MSRALVWLVAVVAMAWCGELRAHELRPAYLELTQTSKDGFAVVWKLPALGDRKLALDVVLPDACQDRDEAVAMIADGAFIERRSVVCAGGLSGGEIAIDGLRATLTDALVRIGYLDGSRTLARLTPDQASFRVAGGGGGLAVARTYFALGVEHILTGLDHLLFVLALLALVGGRPWMLAKTITAFTLAHSITLAGAALGYLSLPQQPVDAVVALSIAFIARELVVGDARRGRLSRTRPWTVAFAFGLLHGFGFAGALKEIGLPQDDVPLALLTFNAGIEVGQLLFAAVVGVLVIALRTLFETQPGRAQAATGYAIGAVAMVWLLGRLSVLSA